MKVNIKELMAENVGKNKGVIMAENEWKIKELMAENECENKRS